MDEEKRVTLRLPAELHEQLTTQAKLDHRSLNAQILYLLETALDGIGSPGGESA